MLDNAVAHYIDLTSKQGVGPATALTHTEQRYGITREVLLERVNGRVAQPEWTRELLAETRAWLTGDGDPLRGAPEILPDLYEAITGENPPGPGYAQDGQA